MAEAQSAVANCIIINNEKIVRKFQLKRDGTSHTIRYGSDSPEPIEVLSSNKERILFQQKRKNGALGIALVHDEQRVEKTLRKQRVVLMYLDPKGNVISTTGGACESIGFEPTSSGAKGE